MAAMSKKERDRRGRVRNFVALCRDTATLARPGQSTATRTYSDLFFREDDNSAELAVDRRLEHEEVIFALLLAAVVVEAGDYPLID